jgi:DNA polymerase-3 subunit alpha
MNFKDVNILTKNFDDVKDFKSDQEMLDKGMEQIPALKNFFTTHENVLSAVKGLMGNVKTTGIHAGGIVVAGDDVTQIVPCHFEKKKEHMWVTQPDMNYVEWAGLIKYDFLGLNTLNDINRCFRLIEKKVWKTINFSKNTIK